MADENANNHHQSGEVNVHNPHDANFKKTFKEVRIAKDVIQHNLPAEMIQDMDLDTLHLLDGSFVSEDLKETFTDVLYGVEVAGHGVYVAFLLEHKSAPDKFAIFQVTRYIIDLWEQSFKEKSELPIVIPIIFYHGINTWNYETDISKYIRDYDELPDYLKLRLPTMKHDFMTMRRQDEEEMQKYQPLTRLILRSFKYVFYDQETLLKYFVISVDELGEHVSDEDKRRFIDLMLFYYSQSNKEFTEADLLRKIRQLDGKGEEIVSILQEREKKGREEGILEGREEGVEEGILKGREETALEMLQDGLSVERIAKYSKLSVEKVEELQKTNGARH